MPRKFKKMLHVVLTPEVYGYTTYGIEDIVTVNTYVFTCGRNPRINGYKLLSESRKRFIKLLEARKKGQTHIYRPRRFARTLRYEELVAIKEAFDIKYANSNIDYKCTIRKPLARIFYTVKIIPGDNRVCLTYYGRNSHATGKESTIRALLASKGIKILERRDNVDFISVDDFVSFYNSCAPIIKGRFHFVQNLKLPEINVVFLDGKYICTFDFPLGFYTLENSRIEPKYTLDFYPHGTYRIYKGTYTVLYKSLDELSQAISSASYNGIKYIKYNNTKICRNSINTCNIHFYGYTQNKNAFGIFRAYTKSPILLTTTVSVDNYVFRFVVSNTKESSVNKNIITVVFSNDTTPGYYIGKLPKFLPKKIIQVVLKKLSGLHFGYACTFHELPKPAVYSPDVKIMFGFELETGVSQLEVCPFIQNSWTFDGGGVEIRSHLIIDPSFEKLFTQFDHMMLQLREKPYRTASSGTHLHLSVNIPYADKNIKFTTALYGNIEYYVLKWYQALSFFDTFLPLGRRHSRYGLAFKKVSDGLYHTDDARFDWMNWYHDPYVMEMGRSSVLRKVRVTDTTVHIEWRGTDQCPSGLFLGLKTEVLLAMVKQALHDTKNKIVNNLFDTRLQQNAYIKADNIEDVTNVVCRNEAWKFVHQFRQYFTEEVYRGLVAWVKYVSVCDADTGSEDWFARHEKIIVYKMGSAYINKLISSEHYTTELRGLGGGYSHEPVMYCANCGSQTSFDKEVHVACDVVGAAFCKRCLAKMKKSTWISNKIRLGV